MERVERRATARPRLGRPLGRSVELLPGLALTAAGVAVALLVNRVAPPLSALTVAVVTGAVLANARVVPAAAKAGTQFAAKRLLRAGVALLGLQLSAVEVARFGVSGLAAVLAAVAVSFFGTRWLGRRLGLSPGLSLSPRSLALAAGWEHRCAAAALEMLPSSTALTNRSSVSRSGRRRAATR